MKVTVENKKGLNKDLKIFIDKKTMSSYIDEKYEEIKGTVNLKGFRPGKVPVAVLKRQFGKAIYGETLEKILQETSHQAIHEQKIKIAGQPKIDLKSHGEDKDLVYNMEVDELPTVKLKSIEEIKFTDYEIEVSEKEINTKLNEIAKNQNNFIEKKDNEPAVKDDLISFDYEAQVDNKSFEGNQGKNTQIVLGKDLFIKGFDEQLIGAKKDQNKEVRVNLPENYPKKELANKKALFKCKILNVKKNIPVEINDEFAKNLGAKDIKDLKKLIGKQINSQYKMSLDSFSKENILNQLEKMHDIKLPDNLVKQELEIISQGLKKEDLENNKKEREEVAKKRIKLGLILNEFGEKNNLKVTENELQAEIQKQVQSMPNQQKQVLEYFQKNPSAVASLRGTIYEEKIINLMKQKSKISKKKISTSEAEEIIKEYSKKDQPKKSKKTVKSSPIKKKVRKK